jgi:hypothetical protein
MVFFYSTCIFCFTFLVINLWFHLWNFPTWSKSMIQISTLAKVMMTNGCFGWFSIVGIWRVKHVSILVLYWKYVVGLEEHTTTIEMWLARIVAMYPCLLEAHNLWISILHLTQRNTLSGMGSIILKLLIKSLCPSSFQANFSYHHLNSISNTYAILIFLNFRCCYIYKLLMRF